MAEQDAPVRGPKARRIATWVLLSVGALITLFGLLLIIAAVVEDGRIDRNLGRADAEVVSVSVQRTLVKYQTPDGAEHIPSVGVLYPEALEEGQRVRVEYDLSNPELVRVAGRSASLTVLPVGTTVLVTWLIVLPTVWWLRRRSHVTLERKFGAQV